MFMKPNTIYLEYICFSLWKNGYTVSRRALLALALALSIAIVYIGKGKDFLPAGGYRALLCGDIEKEAEMGILELSEDIRCNALKVAHHGSDTTARINTVRSPSRSPAAV